jgi:hypothetical protein
MKKVWVSLRVIEGEYETENDAADGMNAEYGGNFDMNHELCDRIIGLDPGDIFGLLLRLNEQTQKEQDA